MFGKKKVTTTEVKDQKHCALCGLDCPDKTTLDRHMSWAHKDAAGSEQGKAKVN